MKINRQQAQFQPITIVIESQEELAVLVSRTMAKDPYISSVLNAICAELHAKLKELS